MPDKTVAAKMRIKAGAKLAVLHAPPGLVDSLGLPPDVTFVDAPGNADCVLLFVSKRAEVEERMPPTVAAISSATDFWAVFPKGSKGAGLDMSRNTVWEVADTLGMRPLGVVRVDDNWAGFHLKKPAE